MKVLYQKQLLIALLFPFALCFYIFSGFFFFFFKHLPLIRSTPRYFKTNSNNRNYGCERGDVAYVVGKVVNYTLPAKEFLVFSQMAE